MAITVSIKSNFHQLECPTKENELDCENQQIQIAYHCSRCAIECLKCESPRLNTNLPYVRGCREARQAIARLFFCICTDYEM